MDLAAEPGRSEILSQPQHHQPGPLRVNDVDLPLRRHWINRIRSLSQLHRPKVFQDSPKIRLQRNAHGSISIQEGQPYNLFILPRVVSFRLRRNSSAMSAGYSPSITMVRFRRRKTAA
jgi:hypothetical protein